MQLRGRSCLAIALVALSLVGCAEGMHVYRPVNATSSVGELPAARYALPPEHPTGEVFIASSGLTQLPESDARAPALFVRMVVSNQSDPSPWRLDMRQQFVFIREQWERPYVSASRQSQTVIEIPRGEKRIVDLYYRLPDKIDGDDEVPRFELAWNVLTGERFVNERLAFDRTRIEPVYYGYGPGWRRYGWYDPYYWPYPYYGVHIGVGYYGGFRGYGGRGYGGYGGHVRAPYVRAAPSRR